MPETDLNKEQNSASEDTLISSLFYLMSRFAFSNERSLTNAIALHLAMLEKHEDTSPQMRITCRRLRAQWLDQQDRLDHRQNGTHRAHGTGVGMQNIH
ncbi:MAG: hypothetical protein AAF542_04075 [Pseudomonadota bacterium]